MYSLDSRFRSLPLAAPAAAHVSRQAGAIVRFARWVTLLAGCAAATGLAHAGPLDTWSTVPLSPGALTTANDMIHVNGAFWAAGSSGRVQFSTDGSQWTVVQTPATGHLTALTYAQGRYVAVGYNRAILSSPNGADWTLHPAGGGNGSSAFTHVAYGNGQFIAVAGKGEAQRSPDGVNWTFATMNYNDFSANGVAWGNGTWVVVGDGIGTQSALTSPDGVTWTKRSTGVSPRLEAVAFGAGVFVATGWDNTIVTSPDGITWTKREVVHPFLGRFWGVQYTNGHFIAFGQGGRFYTSPDGATWTQQTMGSSAGIAAVAYNGDAVLVFRELSGGARRSAHWPPASGGNPGPGPSDPVPLPPTQPPVTAQIGNLSTRAWVGEGESQLISGFVIQGTGAKTVLVRAVGPTLAVFGLEGTLNNPQLRIVNGSGNEVAANDDWSTNPNMNAIVSATATVGAFALPAGSQDAVILVTLPPGAYNLLISGVGGATGVALAEVYDVDSQTACKLINIASRGYVGAGTQAAIPGFVVAGTQPRKLLIRGVGPTLGVFGVGGVITDPRITLFNGSNLAIAQNDDWGAGEDVAGLVAATAQVGAFALSAGSADAAMLVTIPPGSYTVVVSGVGTGTGVGLVEVYEVP